MPLNNRLLAMDLDKTLLMEDGSIPDEVIKRLRELNSEGVRIAICTGRVRTSAEHYAKLIGGASIVSFNGSVIVSENGKKIESFIPLALVKEVIDFCYDNGVYVQLYDGETILVEKYTPELETDLDINFTRYEERGDLRRTELNPTPKMISLELSDRIDDVIIEMRERFPQLTMANSSRYVIEIMPKGIDKGYGLSVIAEELGVDRKDIVAVGDSMNDLPMIEWAGTGVAVANADERLKKAADKVTEGKMSYGVLEAADNLF